MSCDLDRSQPMPAVAAHPARVLASRPRAPRRLAETPKEGPDPTRTRAFHLHALRVAVVRTRHLFAWDRQLALARGPKTNHDPTGSDATRRTFVRLSPNRGEARRPPHPHRTPRIAIARIEAQGRTTDVAADLVRRVDPCPLQEHLPDARIGHPTEVGPWQSSMRATRSKRKRSRCSHGGTTTPTSARSVARSRRRIDATQRRVHALRGLRRGMSSTG